MADRGDRPIFTNTLNQLVFEPSGPRNARSPKSTKDTRVYGPPDARQRGEKQSLNIASIPLRHLKILIDCLKVPTLVKRYPPSSSCFPLYFPRQQPRPNPLPVGLLT